MLIPFKLDLYAYNYFNQLHLSNPKEQIIEVSDLDNIKNNSIIYFYLSETNYNRIFYNQSKQWIDKNCNIVYKIHNNYHYDQNNKYRDTEPYAGDFIKCIRK